MGVYLRDGDARALLASSIYPEGRWFRIGDEVEGGTLTGIGPDSVEIVSPSETREIQLYVEKSASR
jgi:hypothetical protein